MLGAEPLSQQATAPVRADIAPEQDRSRMTEIPERGCSSSAVSLYLELQSVKLLPFPSLTQKVPMASMVNVRFAHLELGRGFPL